MLKSNAKPGIWLVSQARKLISPSERESIEKTPDDSADARLTCSKAVIQVAANNTKEMDDPPATFFAIVGAPNSARIADSPCIKMPHVTGSHVAI